MSAGRRILCSNIALAGRSGTELFLFDLLRGLRQRGYQTGVYSPRIGPLAAEFRAAGIPVWSRTADIPWTPDLLHCQHALETLELLGRFPGVPAIYVCHDAQAWFDAPPPSPAIRRFAAVDEYCRQRVVSETNQPQEAVAVIPNGVDLARFLPRAPLPPRPRRALLFTSHAADTRYIDVVRHACRDMQLPLDEAGPAVGQTVAQPEEALGRYDLVFAKARCALEAMAVGCAVVLVGPEGCGPLVAPESMEAFRRLNFGRKLLTAEFDPARVAREVARYDPAAAHQVREWVRATCGVDCMVESFRRLYEEVWSGPTVPANEPLTGYLARLAAGTNGQLLRLEQAVEAFAQQRQAGHAPEGELAPQPPRWWVRFWRRLRGKGQR